MSLPKVWSRFTVKKSDGTEVKLRIQDAPDALYGDALDFFSKYYFTEDPLHKAAGTAKTPQALKEARDVYGGKGKDPKQNFVICCADVGDSNNVKEIIGVSLMYLQTKDDGAEEMEKYMSELQTTEVKKFMELAYGLMEVYDNFKKLDKHFIGSGIVVKPEYRGCGIATQFIKTRRAISKDQNVPAIGAWMTTIPVQKAAEKDGWKTLAEVELEQYGKKHGVAFENTPKIAKFMIAQA